MYLRRNSITNMTEQAKYSLKANPLNRFIRIALDNLPGSILIYIAFSLALGLLPILQIYLYKLIVDAVSFALAPGDLASPGGLSIFVIIILTGAVYFVNSALTTLNGIWLRKYSMQLTDRISQIIHTKSIRLDLAYFEHSRYRDIIHRAQREANFRPGRLLGNLSSILQTSISIVGIIYLLVSLHWGITIVLILSTIPEIVIRFRTSRSFYDWERENTQAERRSRYYSWMLTVYTYAKEVKINELGGVFTLQFDNIRQRLREGLYKLLKKRSKQEIAAQGLATLAVFGSYGFIAFRTINGLLTIGDLVMYFQALQRGVGFLRSIMTNLAGVYENNLFLANLFELLDLKPEVRDIAAPLPYPKSDKIAVKFEGVSFHYPGRDEFVLQDIDLELSSGRIISLIGENGSGKSTLVKLLCRFYNPSQGNITLNGKSLKEYSITELQRNIGVIFQDYSRFQLSAKENIGFGRSYEEYTMDKIRTAAEKSGAHKFIESLPKEYEAILGNWFDDGREISQGEWQKIALARVLYSDAKVLIFDEPLNSLDVRSRYELLHKFRDLVKDKSVIVISHLIELAMQADEIYVLKNGRIVESGTHEELLQRAGGEYSWMYQARADYFKPS